MEFNKHHVVEYLNWLAGSINPINHNEYFNIPKQSDDPLEDLELYLDKKRTYLIRAKGKNLLLLLKEIITSPSSVDVPFALNFREELKALFKHYQGTTEGSFLKKAIEESINPHESDHLVTVALETL